LIDLVDRIYKNLIFEDRYLLVVEGVKNTLIIALIACILGCLIGLLICSMRTSKNKGLSITARVYIRFFRSTPIVLLLLLTYYVVFANSRLSALVVAIIAFGFYNGAYVAEIFRSGLKTVKDEQIEASYAMGFSKQQTFRYVILPQAVRVIFPVYKSEFINLIKLTAIVGYIGVQDLTRSIDIIRSQTFDALFPLVFALILYFIIIGALTFGLNIIEKRINPRKA